VTEEERQRKKKEVGRTQHGGKADTCTELQKKSKKAVLRISDEKLGKLGGR